MISFANPFVKRNFLIAGTVILFMGVVQGFSSFAPALKDHIQHLEFVSIGLMVMMSLVVMLFWSLSGVFGGLASLLGALICLHKPLADLNPYYYSVLVIAFFTNSFVGYSISKKLNILSQQYIITKEKISEDTNLIQDHMESREAEVLAMGEKVDSLLKLQNIADGLCLSLSSDEIIKIVSEETYNVFKDSSRVMLFTTDGKNKELKLSRISKDSARKTFVIKNGGIFDRWALKNMKSLLVKDVKKDFRFSVSGEELEDDAVSIIIKPLVVENNVLGVLRVDSMRTESFAQYELRILDIIGELAAVALENARLYQQTEELAIKDSLTGLYVHRYFMERMEEEVKRALRSDSSFALLMLDIDNFKEFNDKYGHISGDRILKKIGRVLESKVSAGDVVARYGGEEFALLVLNCSRKKAVTLANDIGKEIQESPVVLRRKKRSVTVSIGVAVFPEDAKLREDIIWEADRFLYKAKSKGKNTVCSK